MNRIFRCPSCGKLLSQTEPDHRNKDLSVRVKCCINSQCKLRKFSGCLICDCDNNTGSITDFVWNHSNSKNHKLVLSNINNDTTEMEVRNLANNFIINFDTGNEADDLNNVSDAHTHGMRPLPKTNTNVGTSNIPTNNCSNFKDLVDYLIEKKESLEYYLDYLKKTSEEVDKEMLIELSETEPTYKKYLNYFFSCIQDKGPNYVVHKAIGQIKHQYIYRDDSNAMYTLLQTKLCAGITIFFCNYSAPLGKSKPVYSQRTRGGQHTKSSLNF